MRKLTSILCVLIFFLSCEEAFVPDSSQYEEQIVVEGFIEAGEGSIPAYVLLSKSLSFFSEIDIETINNSIVRNADVRVSDGVNNVKLTEICLDQIPVEFKDIVIEQLGINPDTSQFDACIYLDVFDELDRKIGGKYDLIITAEGKEITGSTIIPEFVGLDSIWFEEPPGVPSDSLAQMWIRVTDPAGTSNFYRYQNAINGEGLISPVQSVGNDQLFDGEAFDIPVTRAQDRDDDFDPDSFGLFTRGDTVTLKWMSLDKAHYDFWNTLEFAFFNQGPFSSYTRILYNVDGGIGVWGGYSVRYYKVVVPPL